MGVKGLWSLLNPVARPVQIESMEGKRLAIDSSIWLYQFQATMRDKDGRVLVNAHVLGFLRRINKLLFHGIKPVFVFDGGAPVLKRNTIAERKRKRQGAVQNHARTAERLFAAQMRREAVKAAQAQRDQTAARQAASAAQVATNYAEDEGDVISADATYLEDLENQHAGPSRPRRQDSGPSRAPVPPATPEEPLDPAEERRKKFRKHDPYRLPAADMPTVSTEDKPDARLATEEELKQFIDDMKPSDIDIESAEFRALPTEVQYEIIGDLRIRSRQQSHQRLTSMLRGAPTALDFSMAQIKNLSQRNVLTQQLLTVTDMVGKAHLTIPVRIAAERNREYVLLKRGEDVGGGWALGIREGTKQKPIEIPEEKDEESSDESSESEEDDEIVEVKKPPVDPDLAQHRRRQMLDAISARYAPKPSPRKSLDVPVTPFGPSHAPTSAPLFDDPEMFAEMDDVVVPTAHDEALALALQQEELGSDEDEADPDLARALALSRRDRADGGRSPSREISVKPDLVAEPDEDEGSTSDDSMEEVDLVPSGSNTPVALDTPTIGVQEDEDEFEGVSAIGPTVGQSQVAEPIGGAKPEAPLPVANAMPLPDRRETTLQPSAEIVGVAASRPLKPEPARRVADEPFTVDDDDDKPIFIAIQPPTPKKHNAGRRDVPTAVSRVSDPPERPVVTPPPESSRPAHTPPQSQGTEVPAHVPVDQPPNRPVAGAPSRSSSLLNRPPIPSPLSRSPSVQQLTTSPAPEAIPNRLPRAGSSPPAAIPLGLVEPEPERLIDEALSGAAGAWRTGSAAPSSRSASAPARDDDEDTDEDDEDNDEEEHDDSRSIEWSRSPSPLRRKPPKRPPLQAGESGQSIDTIPSEVEDEDVDMQPGDMVNEQDDYARFLAQIKNRDLNEVRTEIDDEIRVLHGQNKVAMRDSDEITMAMIAQIQTLLRHFGIPYITAPMEAEAQCAKLAELGLVDGIITDDSDVFLFGGTQCFKNIFNDNKYAECFLSSDISRELSLSRDRLISLAYLLGSDYTIGLPGVGPVVALELMANFPGERGIDEFKEWWGRVQKGQDGVSTDTKWKSSFKKRYAGLIFITADWPNPLVREAYKYPVTDESEEAFHWGFPKLSALRSYLHEELSWSISKVDDELTPIVQRIARRGKTGSVNKQATLDPYFDLSAGALANYAPRKRTTANISKRLMSVIKQFREAEARVLGGGEAVTPEWSTMMEDLDEEDPKGRGTGKRALSRKRSAQKVSTGAEGEEGLNPEGEEDGAKVVRKRKPRRTKSGTAVSTESALGDGASEDGYTPPPPKRPARPRAKKASSSLQDVKDADTVANTKDDDIMDGATQLDVTDISQIPVEQRGKWRRQQQKKWRRAAVANSVRPN